MNYEMKGILEGNGTPAGKDSASTSLFRGTSCVGEPQESALRCLQTKDLRLFTDIVNNPDVENLGTFPLPKEHWINKELEDKNGNTLLLEAIR